MDIEDVFVISVIVVLLALVLWGIFNFVPIAANYFALHPIITAHPTGFPTVVR